jgi:hypothetical protein
VVRSQEHDAEAFVTWRSAVTIAALAASLTILSHLNFPDVIRRPLAISRLVTLGWESALLGILISQRRKPGLGASSVAFGLTAVPVLPMFWLIAHERTLRGLPLELFARENAAAIVFALTTPPSATVCLIVIAACTAQAVLSYWIGGFPISLATLRLEPWTSMLFGMFAAAVALYRARRQRREVALIVEAERSAALGRLMRAYLAVRDLVNTPLQTLGISLSLLTTRRPEDRQLHQAMERSVERLRELNRTLATERAAVAFRPGEESFDPIAVLRTPAPESE